MEIVKFLADLHSIPSLGTYRPVFGMGGYEHLWPNFVIRNIPWMIEFYTYVLIGDDEKQTNKPILKKILTLQKKNANSLATSALF